MKRQRAGDGGDEGVEGSTQPSQLPKVSQSTNAAALPKGGEEKLKEKQFWGGDGVLPVRALVGEGAGR